MFLPYRWNLVLSLGLLFSGCRESESVSWRTGLLQQSGEARALVKELRLRTLEQASPGVPEMGFLVGSSSICSVRSLIDSGLVEKIERHGFSLIPILGSRSSPDELLAEVILPSSASDSFRLREHRSDVAVDVSLVGADCARAELADGLIIYRGAYPSADVLHRVSQRGTENFIVFQRAPDEPAVSYRVSLDRSVAGLRLVANTLEFLDNGGVPRLRTSPPFLLDNEGLRHPARLSVADCSVDENPAAPWDRPVRPPGSTRCVIRIAWENTGVQFPAVLDPEWMTTDDPSIERFLHTATVLSNGKVLVTGGFLLSGPLASSELYDPQTASWSATGSMTEPRDAHSATLLQNGNVIVVGGANNTSTHLETAELYDPQTGTWHATGRLSDGRLWHSANLLTNGDVLVTAGGYTVSSGYLASAEIFHPDSGAWTAAGSLATGRIFHTATVLPNGKVLVAGGYGLSGPPPARSLSSVELFDPTTRSWSVIQSMTSARSGHTANLLADGRVLVAGGDDSVGPISHGWLSSAELYDLDSGTWQPTESMSNARDLHTANTLRSGSVIVIAGGNADGGLSSAEIYDPRSATWRTVASMSQERWRHTATTLANSSVLVVGGVNQGVFLSNAELYAPLGTSCRSDRQCPTGSCVDNVCCNETCGGQCEACDVEISPGVCTLVSGPPHGDRAQCRSDGSICGGVCDGVEGRSCAYPQRGTRCRIGRHRGFCDGAGTCRRR